MTIQNGPAPIIKRLGLILLVIQGVSAQTFSPCDLNHDRAVNVVDVQTIVNEALGLSLCTADLNGDGRCDVVDVQRVITAALGGSCTATVPIGVNMSEAEYSWGSFPGASDLAYINS